MKKIIVFLASISLLSACNEKHDLQEYEPVFDNYAQVLRIVEVSRDFITLKNNTGSTVNVAEYIYSDGDTTVRVSSSTINIPHQDSYTFATAKPVDFKEDIISLYKEDFSTLDTTLVDQFFPVGGSGF